MESRAREAVAPRNVGIGRMVQPPIRRRSPCGDRPRRSPLPDEAASSQVAPWKVGRVASGHQPVALGGLAQEGQDLALRRIHPLQSAFGRRRGIEVGGDVAGRPRIGVVVPRAADAVGLSITRSGPIPACLQRIAMASPEKPAPTIRTARGSGRRRAEIPSSVKLPKRRRFRRMAFRGVGLVEGGAGLRSMLAANCQAWATTGKILSSASTPAARARSAMRTESSRSTSRPPHGTAGAGTRSGRR